MPASERNSDGVNWLPAAHFVLNFRDPAPPSPRGVLAYATPKRLPFRLITRNLSSGMWPSFFNSFSKSALNAASASTIASKDFFTSAGKSSASIFCHFNSSRAMLCSNEKAHTLFRDHPIFRLTDHECGSVHRAKFRWLVLNASWLSE